MKMKMSDQNIEDLLVNLLKVLDLLNSSPSIIYFILTLYINCEWIPSTIYDFYQPIHTGASCK